MVMEGKGIGAVISTAASYVDPREYGFSVGTVSEMAGRVNQVAGPLVLATGLYALSGVDAGPVLGSLCSGTVIASGGTAAPAIVWCAWLWGVPGL